MHHVKPKKRTLKRMCDGIDEENPPQVPSHVTPLHALAHHFSGI